MKKSLFIILPLVLVGTVTALTWVDAADKPAGDLGPEAPGLVAHSIERAKFAAMPPSAEQIEAGKRGWETVYEVLVSPRCMNCHPVGDHPLQGDQSLPHAQNIDRKSVV